jgi:hypothetical protein
MSRRPTIGCPDLPPFRRPADRVWAASGQLRPSVMTRFVAYPQLRDEKGAQETNVSSCPNAGGSRRRACGRGTVMGGVAPASSLHETSNAAMYYRSTQAIAPLTLRTPFESWGQPESLAKMIRSYFTVAENCAARLVRVRWIGSRPAIFLAWPPVVMIAMEDTTFELGTDRRAIHTAIRAGLLVMPGSQPHLVITLARRPGSVEATVDLVNYQPRWGNWAVVRWLYAHTQVPVHVWVASLPAPASPRLDRLTGADVLQSGPAR